MSQTDEHQTRRQILVQRNDVQIGLPLRDFQANHQVYGISKTRISFENKIESSKQVSDLLKYNSILK